MFAYQTKSQMIKYKLLFSLLILGLFSSVRAEVINGQAAFRFQPKGTVFVTLKDGMEVECGPLENGWFKISITVKITKEQYNGDFKKGGKLFDTNKKFIGVALTDVPDDSSMPMSYGDGSYEMQIFGYVAKANIKESSIPESTLEYVFKSKAGNLRYDSLNSFLIKQRYMRMNLIHKTLPQLAEYCIYESTVVDESPGYRIGLIFEGNDLIAIEHSRPLKFIKSKEYSVLGRNKLFVIRPPKGFSAKAFAEKISEANQGAD